jgi:phosphohistidine swiveling domain-containing protein
MRSQATMPTAAGAVAAAAASDLHGRELALVAGAKAANLDRAARRGVAVPRWTAVTVDVLRTFRAATGLDERIAEALHGLDAHGAAVAAARIAEAFAAAEIDATTAQAIADAYARVGGGRVAVRSSGINEDGARHSFAGQYASYLNVAGTATVATRVKDCWASAYSERALHYRLLHGLPLGAVDMGVIVQEIVAAEKSGVVFTVNPASGCRDEIVVSAVPGLGEALVSGSVDADTIVVGRADGRVRSVTVGDKEQRVDPAPDGSGTVVHSTAGDVRASLCLDEREIAEICALALRVESVFGAPQDVEWAIADGRHWVLQARPVTGAAPRRGDGELRMWDNSNIIESYGEVTAPLTYSFARHAYHRVYRDYAQLLGVPPRHLVRMDEWLPNMLGFFNGHVYYNLLNWYKVIRLLPFYRLNRRVLELSMGVQEPLDDDLAELQRPIETASRVERLALHALFAARFAWYFTTIERSVDRFLRDFYRVYDEFDALDVSDWSADEAYGCYREIERRLLSRWGRMILLEATIGLAFGTLHLLTRRWLPDAPESLLYEVARVDEDVESTHPAHRIAELARLASGDPRLRELLLDTPSALAFETLERSRDDAAVGRLLGEVERFLRDFGDRNVNELKLEEPDLRDDPSMLFSLLRASLARTGGEPLRPAAARQSADEYLSDRLRGWRGVVYGAVRRKVRRSLAARERVRFCRTRAFGMARRIFKVIGADLARVGAIASPDDVFQLRLEELRGCFEGTIGHGELRALVELRRAREAEYRRLVAPPRFVTRGSVYWGDLERAWAPAGAADADGDEGSRLELRGTPSSPGTASAPARVVQRPADVGGDVLVAYRTDPGWVPVLPSASALLIERGSPLTHVAIVARELGIPTVVQIPRLTQRVRTGMRLHVDGDAGVVTAEARGGSR